MEQDPQSVEGSDAATAPETRWRYLKYVPWSIASLILISVVVLLGTYLTNVKRVIGFKNVYEPPPSIRYRTVAHVLGDPYIPKHYHPALIRLYRRMHAIDKKWIRPKWWTEPQFTPEEQAAMGVTLGVPLQ